MTNYTKRTLYNTAIVLVCSVAAGVFSYLFRIFLANNLSLSDYGLYYSLMAFSGLLLIFRDFGMLQAACFFIPRLIAHNKKSQVKGMLSGILRVETIASLMIMGLLILFSGWLTRNYFRYGTELIIVLIGIGFFLNSLELNFHAFFLAFQSMITYSIQNLARNMLLFAITLLAFKHFDGIYVPIVTYIINYALILIIFSFIFFLRVFPDYFRIRSGSANLKGLISFGIPATLAYLGFSVVTISDTLILTYFRSLEEVGLYNTVVPIVNLMLYIPLAISTVILPLVAELKARRKTSSLRFAVEKITKFVWIILIPMAAVLMIYPEITINVLFGNKFSAAGDALVILSIGAVFYGMAFINITFLQGIIGPRLNAYIALSSLFLDILLNLFLIPRYGIIGAAFSSTASYFLSFIASTIILNRAVRRRSEFGRYLLVLVSGIMFVVIISFLKWMMNLNPLLEGMLVVGFSGLVYLGILFMLRVITVEEIMEIRTQLFMKR